MSDVFRQGLPIFTKKKMDQRFPEAFVARMKKQLGDDFDNFIGSLSLPAPISIRYNIKKYPLPDTMNYVPWEPSAIYLDERPVFTLDPLLHAGAYYVQEASSMFSGWIAKNLLEKNQTYRVLDLCAAPGGKSTHIASVLNNQSLLVSNEVIGSRASILAENMIKWGNPNVFITRNDPKDFIAFPSFFDLIVVDAPCSGEGLFRRDASAINEWSVENTTLCTQRQQRIVNDIWDSLKPGGHLIYSTCTYNPAENDENMKWLIEKKGATPVFFETPTEWNIHYIQNNDIQGYQFYPHKIKGEGFFISVVCKTDGEVLKTAKGKSKKALQHPVKPVINELTSYLMPDSEFIFFQLQDKVIAIPSIFEHEFNYLQERLHFIEAGIEMARIFGQKIIPEHGLALSLALNKSAFNQVELSKSEALHYLHRDAIFIPGAKPGINLVTYNKLSLGWIKNIGNRWNNLYPQNWRIRMDLSDKTID